MAGTTWGGMETTRVPAADSGVPTMGTADPGQGADDAHRPRRHVKVPTAQLEHLTTAQCTPRAQQHERTQPFRHRLDDHLELLDRRRADLTGPRRAGRPADPARVAVDHLVGDRRVITAFSSA